jgi:hypothetical protein
MTTKLQKLWKTYSSQELFGESLREEDPELFDELDAAITEAAEREPLVQGLIDFHREIMRSARSWTTEEKAQGGQRMAELVTKLAEWKP